MKQANKRPVGRPRMAKELKVKFKTLPVICSPEEYEAVVLIAKNLKYQSISALLRSAISKGIFLSSHKGLLTEEKDQIFWKYWERNWDLTKHLRENDQHLSRIQKAKNIEDC